MLTTRSKEVGLNGEMHVAARQVLKGHTTGACYPWNLSTVPSWDHQHRPKLRFLAIALLLVCRHIGCHSRRSQHAEEIQQHIAEGYSGGQLRRPLEWFEL